MRQSLGKGLQSLIPKKQSKSSGKILEERTIKLDQPKSKKESIFNIEIDKVRPNPDQPRKDVSSEGLKELASSIREHGVLQPLIVTKIEKPTERGQQVEYELVAGERRWRAARMAGFPYVPVIIRDSSAHEKLEIALVENLQRENLNSLETALAFKQLQKDFGLKQREIAQKVGKSRVAVTNILRLLTLPPKIQEALASNQISEGHGRAILIAKPSAQIGLFRAIIRNKWGVRLAEEKARDLSLVYKPRSQGPKNLLFKKMEKQLGEVMGRRISITQRGDLGHLRIEFADRKDLGRIIDYLSKF